MSAPGSCPHCGRPATASACPHCRRDRGEPSVAIECPACGARYPRVPRRHLGKRTRCRACRSAFVLREVAQPAGEDAAASATRFQPPVSDDAAATRVTTPGAPGVASGSASGTVSSPAPPAPGPPAGIAAWKTGDLILDLYEITGQLGEGGMGKVHRVLHRGWKMELAVKSPRAAVLVRAGGKESFRREAETWVNLGLHPHVVSCYYVREVDGVPRVFAEYVSGGSLADWIASGRLYAGETDQVLARILDIAVQFAWGLHHAHQRGLIHQDVKPANLMMTPGGIAKVTDFGLTAGPPPAVSGSGAVDGDQTLSVDGVGMTPAYAAPEQMAGRRLTRRADLWSWAVSLLEMVLGRRTWAVGSVARGTLEAHLDGSGPPGRLPSMPEPLADLLGRCLQEDPDDRPRTLRDAARRLQEAYRQVVGTPYPRTEPVAARAMAAGLNNRALSLLDLGREEEARDLWRKALAIDPHHPETTSNRGLVHWRKARWTDEDLVRAMGEVLRSHRADWHDDCCLARIHLEREDSGAALEVLSGLAGDEQAREEVRAVKALAAGRRAEAPAFAGEIGEFYGTVHSLDVSPGGGRVAAAAGLRELHLWRIDDGRLLQDFSGAGDSLLAVAFGAGGRRLIAGGEDGTARVWDAADGACRAILEGHEGRVCAVALAPGGRLAATGAVPRLMSGSDSDALRLWDLPDGRCRQSLAGHEYAVSAVRFTADGRYLLSAGWDRTLRLWDVASGKCLQVFRGHGDRVTAAVLLPGGRFLSASGDRTLRLWEMESGRCLRTFAGHSGAVAAVHADREGRLAVSGGEDRTVRVWEVASGRCLRTFTGHTGVVNDVRMTPDGLRAVSGGFGQRPRLWSTAFAGDYRAPMTIARVNTSEVVLGVQREYEDRLGEAAAALEAGDYSAAARRVRAARSLNGCARRARAVSLWTGLYSRMPRRGLLGAWQLRALRNGGYRTPFAPGAGGRSVLVAADKGDFVRLDLETGRERARFSHGWLHVTALAVDPGGLHALSGGTNKKVRLWEIDSGRCLRTLEGHRGAVTAVAGGCGGRVALSGGRDHTVRLWDTGDGGCLQVFRGHTDIVTAVALLPDGSAAVSAGLDRTLRVWDPATGRCRRTLAGHGRPVRALATAPDGRRLASAGGDPPAQLWDAATGEAAGVLEGHDGAVASVDFSPDGRFLLTGGADRTVKLWSVDSLRCLRTMEGHTGELQRVAFTADGRYAVSEDRDKVMRVWVLDWDLEARDPQDWDDGARPFIAAFRARREPAEALRLAGLGADGRDGETCRWGREEDRQLLEHLGRAGYGWLRARGVKRML